MTPMKVSPCYKCTRRTETCHDKCIDYFIYSVDRRNVYADRLKHCRAEPNRKVATRAKFLKKKVRDDG